MGLGTIIEVIAIILLVVTALQEPQLTMKFGVAYVKSSIKAINYVIQAAGEVSEKGAEDPCDEWDEYNRNNLTLEKWQELYYVCGEGK